MDRHGHLAVADLLNHEYCQRITWFAYVLGLRQRGTVKTEHGKEKHDEWLKREGNRWREGIGVQTRKKLVSLELISQRLGLRGRLDAAVDDNGSLAPYDVKSTRTPTRPYPGQLLQLAAYALLLEEGGKRVEKGYFHYLVTNEVREQPITAEMKDHVIEVLRSIEEVVKSEEMPPRAPPSHCRDCVYRKLCI